MAARFVHAVGRPVHDGDRHRAAADCAQRAANLVINHSFNINFLMTIAAVGALILGEPAEGAAVVVLFEPVRQWKATQPTARARTFAG